MTSITKCTEILEKLKITDSCAPDPQIALGLLQLALDADYWKKLKPSTESSSISAYCNGPLHVPRLHWSLEQPIDNYSLSSTKIKKKCSFTSDKVHFHITSVQKRIQNWLKNVTIENIYKLSSPQRKSSFNDNFCKKTIPIMFPYNIKSRKESQKSLHTKKLQK